MEEKKGYINNVMVEGGMVETWEGNSIDWCMSSWDPTTLLLLRCGKMLPSATFPA